MAHRKEVFQSKVLQRLYPLPPKPEKEPNSPPPEFVLKKSSVKRKVGLEEEGTITGDGGITPSSAQPGRRVYTVLAPPAEYKTGAEGSVMLTQPAGINTMEDPADENTHESNEDGVEEEEGGGQRRRRRRRKRKGTAPGGGKAAGQATDSKPGDPTLAPTPTEEEGEQLSKNKRRKLKKKRHKEKLLSLGLMPRAAALEFTYQREGDGEEEEDEEDEEMRQRRAAEVMDFLRTTQEIYVSDRSSTAGRLHVSSAVVEGLLTSLSNGTYFPVVLAQLHSLKSLVQQHDAERLAKALQELQNSSTMSPSEATAVVSLFQYWITDILPMQR